jgi:hypothetical protein
MRALYLLSFMLGRKTITSCLVPLLALFMLIFLSLLIYTALSSAFEG